MYEQAEAAARLAKAASKLEEQKLLAESREKSFEDQLAEEKKSSEQKLQKFAERTAKVDLLSCPTSHIFGRVRSGFFDKIRN